MILPTEILEYLTTGVGERESGFHRHAKHSLTVLTKLNLLLDKQAKNISDIKSLITANQASATKAFFGVMKSPQKKPASNLSQPRHATGAYGDWQKHSRPQPAREGVPQGQPAYHPT
ncbi:MAG: hypothetical protein GY743_05800 [Planctomycetaceae bacterium]|nr:hypothetical protein [Planctomycetaceae bacterium]